MHHFVESLQRLFYGVFILTYLRQGHFWPIAYFLCGEAEIYSLTEVSSLSLCFTPYYRPSFERCFQIAFLLQSWKAWTC